MSDEGTVERNVIPLQRHGRSNGGTCGIEQEVLDALNEGLGALEDDLIDAADRNAIDHETVFIKRFGFDAPRQRRRHVFELKHHADLTDREIRLLHRTGSLSFNTAAATISVPIFISVWGWFQLLYLLALMFVTFQVATHVVTPTGVQIIRVIAFEFVLLALVWAVLYVYMRPRRIFQRVTMRALADCDQSSGKP